MKIYPTYKYAILEVFRERLNAFSDADREMRVSAGDGATINEFNPNKLTVLGYCSKYMMELECYDWSYLRERTPPYEANAIFYGANMIYEKATNARLALPK